MVFVTNVGVNVDGKYDVNFLENAKIAMERIIEKKVCIISLFIDLYRNLLFFIYIYYIRLTILDLCKTQGRSRCNTNGC